MSITSHGFQPTLHCPCSWTSLRKPYLAPVNGQKQLLELADDSARRGSASTAICISVHRSGATQQEQESNLQLAVALHCSTELQGSGGGRALTLGQVLELIPTTLAHRDVCHPHDTGVHKSTFLKPSELSALPGLSAFGWCGRLGWGYRCPQAQGSRVWGCSSSWEAFPAPAASPVESRTSGGGEMK